MSDRMISTTSALSMLDKSYGLVITRPTIIHWCRDHGVGRKIGGHWYIDIAKLQTLVEGTNGSTKTK